MSEEHSQHHSFVLRIWWEAQHGASHIWRGRIQHAATGDAQYVGTLDDLLDFIEARTGRLRHSGDRKRPLE
jgi:hypothetical protein